ncbi:protoporphyrinogen oxidase [Planctomyces sp. SH-PL62]|uniref:protoporphyrinogen oxidase n=1 Tax=Planctomyces sp. SH-PL62 TaxID=1636152 RepID=UPI00078CC179|nr:protoporphyrinogen oxidase [Planctomyces sp. SH-PL62]AMV39623.1 Protoporphyrinogen oxidase [Planctomyces sp. SH-PL62]
MTVMTERTSGSKSSDRVVVIGGGLSGLAAANRIQRSGSALRRPVEVVVLEAKDRVGGVIATERRDGFTLELGPDSFITNKPWAADLCRSLDLEDQLIEAAPALRRSFVVRKGKLAPVPEGFVLMAPHRLRPILASPILSLRGKIRLLAEALIPRREKPGEESLAAFVRRRLGREALDRLVQPLVGGMYTGDPNNLSLKATLPQFLAMEQEHGSLIRAAWRRRKDAEARLETESSGARFGMFVSLAEGMGALPRALAATLRAGTVRTNAAVRRITRATNGSGWLVEPLDGPPIEADAVVATTEAHATARMIDGVDPSLALQLRGIPYASSIIVNVAYRRDRIQHPMNGFGFVVPAIEERRILAGSFLNVKFPRRAPEGTALIRVFVGGAAQPELFDLDDDAVRQIVSAELGELIGATGDPIFLEITRHARSMPQYVLGHLELVETIRRKAARHPNLFLTGVAYDGVGIPDCIRAAEATADAVVARLAEPGSIAAA